MFFVTNTTSAHTPCWTCMNPALKNLLVFLLKVHAISKEIDQELHRWLLLTFLIEQCKKSVRNWTRSSAEDICSYSSLKVYGITKEMDQELHRGFLIILLIRSKRLLLIFLMKSVWKQWGHGPGAHRGLLPISHIRDVWNQYGTRPGISQRTSADIP